MALSDEPRQLKLPAAKVALGEEFCAMLGAEWEKEAVRNNSIFSKLTGTPPSAPRREPGHRAGLRESPRVVAAEVKGRIV